MRTAEKNGSGAPVSASSLASEAAGVVGGRASARLRRTEFAHAPDRVLGGLGLLALAIVALVPRTGGHSIDKNGVVLVEVSARAVPRRLNETMRRLFVFDSFSVASCS